MRKAIILAYQVAVDGAQVGQLEKIVAGSSDFHSLLYPLYCLIRLVANMTS